MTNFYLDTSVMVKRYQKEKGTEFADIIYDQIIGSKNHSLTISTLSILEFVATMSRALKGDYISRKYFDNAIILFIKETEHISLRPVDDELLAKAINVVIKHSLRTADAIHLTIALELRDMMAKLNEDVILISNDNEMCEAAQKENLQVLKPSDEEELKSILSNPKS